MPIVNLTRGIADHLTDDQKEKALLMNNYITQRLDFGDLYVSGHWDGVIQSWVLLQMNVINDKALFVRDFKRISDRIKNPVQYTDFVGKLTYYLTQYGKDEYVEAITRTVLESGKVTEYEGSLQVYLKAMSGTQASDLILLDRSEKLGDSGSQTRLLRSKDFAQGTLGKTLLIFYRSGCGACEELFRKLPDKYEALKKHFYQITNH